MGQQMVCCQQERCDSLHCDADFRADSIVVRTLDDEYEEADYHQRYSPLKLKIQHWGASPRSDTDELLFSDERRFQASSSSTMPIESLSYLPAKFEECSTIDTERSSERYSKIAVVHSARLRTQRRSDIWEGWISAASTGRPVVMLIAAVKEARSESLPVVRVPAMYHLDRGQNSLSILPTDRGELAVCNILLTAIQVICAATEYVLFAEQ
ncbi:unnamed protein product, partial [Polarella glacialis]